MVSFKKFITEWSHTPDSITKYLQAKGYKKLGNGVDQTAFLEPGTEQVLKVFGSHYSGHNEGHDMFAYWAKYCKDHSKNPFLPKFSGWTNFTYGKDGKDYLQIRMEKLQKLPPKLSNALGMISGYIEDGDPQKIKKLVLKQLGSKQKDLENESALYIKDFDEINQLAILLGEEKFNLLLDTIISLCKIANQRDYNFDLHGSNFMHRNDGTPIIVDPWVV
jgi:hypothetical protein